MKKTLWLILFKIVIFLVIAFAVLYIYENNHHLSDYESMIWTYTGTDSSEYIVTDRSSHLAYLETVDIDGDTIRYIDRGSRDGTPILLVHGTPTNSWLWRKMIPTLVDAGYRVIAPDQYGFWASDMSSDHEELTIEKQSQRLIWLMESLDIQKYAIAGHDQWSLRVRETITTVPDRISHLVILNSIWDREWFHPPAGFGSANISTKFTGRAMWSKILWRVFAYGAMIGWVSDTSVATMSMVDGYLFPLFHGMSDTYYDFITHFDEIENKLSELQPEFQELDIPATIIRWADDKILVWAQQAPVLAELLDIAEEDIHILPDAAHFIQEEKPKEIVDLLHNFIQSN